MKRHAHTVVGVLVFLFIQLFFSPITFAQTDEMASSSAMLLPNTWQEEFFPNVQLSGAPTWFGYVDQLAYDFGTNAPKDFTPADSFSARFKQHTHFEKGTYEFTISADDGIRISIDGMNIFDAWYDQHTIDSTFTIPITEGNHTIVVEYYDREKEAQIKVNWKFLRPLETQGFSAQYYDNPSLSGFPVLTRIDPEINFSWGSTSPNPSVPKNDFSARFTKTAMFPGGTYTFVTKSDDGIRLKIDGVTYIDKWNNQKTETNSAEVILQAGFHTVIVEYFEHTGDAVLQVSWKVSGALPSKGYRAEFFDNETLSGNSVVTLPYESIHFDWGQNSPDPLVPSNHFSGRIRKTERFEGGIYRFIITADDGVRIYLDETEIFNQWQDRSKTTYTFFRDIPMGTHTVTVEYYDKTDSAVLYADWNRIGNLPSTQFKGEYFDNTTLTGTPRLIRTDNEINFDWNNNSPDSTIPKNNFSVRWLKTESFEGGVYRFRIVADEGVKLFVDDAIVIEKRATNSGQNHVVNLPIANGDHTIRIEYLQQKINSKISVDYEPLR